MGMELLRCKTPEMVEKEIAVHVLAYNIIQGNLAQAAILHDKIPRQLRGCEKTSTLYNYQRGQAAVFPA
jgi:hypothetical protein